MDRPREDSATDAYREHAAFTVSAVAADDEVKGKEAELQACHLELKAEQRNLEDLEEQVQAKRAIFVRKDKACDGVVREFELRLLALVHKKTSDPLYKRYFEDGLRAVTEAEPRLVEPTIVADMITSMNEDAAKPGIGPLATEFKPRFEAALAAVKAAHTDLIAMEGVRDRAKKQNIPAIKLRWVDAYVKLHAALRAAFPRDAARVESYFYPFSKSAKAAKAGEAPPAPTPEPAKPGDAQNKPQ
jgi:hypothetical protein